MLRAALQHYEIGPADVWSKRLRAIFKNEYLCEEICVDVYS